MWFEFEVGRVKINFLGNGLRFWGLRFYGLVFAVWGCGLGVLMLTKVLQVLYAGLRKICGYLF